MRARRAALRVAQTRAKTPRAAASVKSSSPAAAMALIRRARPKTTHAVVDVTSCCERVFVALTRQALARARHARAAQAPKRVSAKPQVRARVRQRTRRVLRARAALKRTLCARVVLKRGRSVAVDVKVDAPERAKEAGVIAREVRLLLSVPNIRRLR